MALSNEQIRQVLRQAGWPEFLIPIMAAIGLGESNGDPTITRYRRAGQGQRLPEASIGLFQINLLAHPEYSAANLTDPVNNARAALQIYQQQGLRAWGSYTDGRYRQYLVGDENAGSPTGSGAGAVPVSSGGGNVVTRYLGLDWLLGNVPNGSDKYGQAAKSGYTFSGQQRYLAAIAIIVIVIAFTWSEF